MSKTLILTDLHFLNKPLGLLEAQKRCILKIFEDESPDEVIFMGDLIMNRKPSPSVLLALKDVLDRINRDTDKITIIRGNHDSETKADDGVTALSVFSVPNIRIITHTHHYHSEKRTYIPHYENEEKIKEHLRETPEDHIVFGHFGYHGCLNSAGDADFTISLSEFRNPTLLGHIHKFHKKSQRNGEGTDATVTILGTPYTTNYTESGKKCYYAILEDGEFQYKEITHGPRHLVVPYKQLEEKEKIINNPAYFTLLRVLVEEIGDENTRSIYSDILNKYTVNHLDIKFNPLIEDKDIVSNYTSSRDLFSINEVIIMDYIKKNNTKLSEDAILEGYKLIKHED